MSSYDAADWMRVAEMAIGAKSDVAAGCPSKKTPPMPLAHSQPLPPTCPPCQSGVQTPAASKRDRRPCPAFGKAPEG